jgi:hypothetical protein
MFLSGFFQSPARNFYSSEEVEIDIVRGDEDVSVVIQDLTTGYRMNSDDLYINKAFKAPIHKEAISLNSVDLLKRMPGKNPFEDPGFRAAIILKMFSGMGKVERKIRRAIELQASQIFQTGALTLTDSDGNSLYALDFKPKATHFPAASVAWGGTSPDMLGDINSLAEVIRNDGIADPDQLIMGNASFRAFIQNADVKASYDTRRIDQGTISPMKVMGNGGTYRGTVEIGNYRYDIWTYGGRYTDPETGTKTTFIADDKVIVRASTGRIDATFGAIPNIGRLLGVQNTNLVPELPGRLSNSAGGMDLFTNVWLSSDGEQLFGGVGCRPLLIPTAMDTYGCLDTGL